MSLVAESREALVAEGLAGKCGPPSLPPHLIGGPWAGRDRVGEEGLAREPTPYACLPAGTGWGQGSQPESL